MEKERNKARVESEIFLRQDFVGLKSGKSAGDGSRWVTHPSSVRVTGEFPKESAVKLIEGRVGKYLRNKYSDEHKIIGVILGSGGTTTDSVGVERVSDGRKFRVRINGDRIEDTYSAAVKQWNHESYAAALRADVGIKIDVLLNEWQQERLCCIVYLDSLYHNRWMGNLGTIVKYMLENGYQGSELAGNLPCLMTKEEWDEVLNDIIGDVNLSALKIVKWEEVDELSAETEVLRGHRAVCFMDDFDNAYVIFRGTCGDDEWEDNALGMVEEDTVQQRASKRFVDEVRVEFKVNRLMVAGHSKGGNKAQYAAIVSADGEVDGCLSIDGQGFSEKFVRKYEREISRKSEKIRLIAERRDFVNCLGFYIGKTQYYSGRRGEHKGGFPKGEPLGKFHTPDALRLGMGRIGIKSAEHDVSVVLNKIVEHFLTDKFYSKDRLKTSRELVSLMKTSTDISEEERAVGVAKIFMVFLDLMGNNESFCRSVNDLLMREEDVIFATASGFGKDGSTDKAEFGKQILSKIAAELLWHPRNMVNFIKSLREFAAIIRAVEAELSRGTVLIENLLEFIGKISGRLSAEHPQESAKRHLSGISGRCDDWRCEIAGSRRVGLTNDALAGDSNSQKSGTYSKIMEEIDNLEGKIAGEE